MGFYAPLEFIDKMLDFCGKTLLRKTRSAWKEFVLFAERVLGLH